MKRVVLSLLVASIPPFGQSPRGVRASSPPPEPCLPSIRRAVQAIRRQDLYPNRLGEDRVCPRLSRGNIDDQLGKLVRVARSGLS